MMLSSRISTFFGKRCVLISGRFLNGFQSRSYFEEKFEQDAQDKILQIMNEPDTDFAKYTLSAKNRVKLLEIRSMNGRFESLEDLMPSISEKVLVY